MRIVFNAKFALQRKIAWLLFFSLFSLCFIGWLIYFNKKNIENTTYWINHTYAVLFHIDKINTRISGWEPGKGPAPKAAFYEALGKDMDRLQQLTRDNPDQEQLATILAGNFRAIRPGADSLALDSLKNTLRDMRHKERDLLSERRLASKTADRKITLLMISGSGLAFLFIVIILMRLNKDIVLRREAELRLKENQGWLQSILDNTTSIIYIKDLTGRYIMANRRFKDVILLKDEEVIGHTDYDFCTKDAADHYQRLDEEVIRTGQSLEIEEIVPSADGDVHLLSIKFPLRDNNGKQIGIGGIATDITERVEYQHQLIAATHEAQTAKGMQELFLANMSHEIRTPMNGIQGMTDLLLGTPLSEQQMEFAGIIKRSVNNLLVIVNDVLDFSKIKAGKLAIEKIEFRLKDVLANAKAVFDHRVKKKGLLFLLEIDPDIPEILIGDPYRLNQVLINLIGNALKFTEQGNIRVNVDLQDRNDQQLHLLFSVSDTGVGIPEVSLPHIFDHFSQAGLDISRRYGGTGLGLAICHHLLQLQGGDITVESLEGKGATFRFHLPYGYTVLSAADTPAAAVLTDYSLCLAGKKFLVAEDNEVNRQLIDHVLKRGGGEVQLADDGKEAVNYLRQGEKYDLIIMDLQMPVMDGYEATRCIREELQLPIPIIAMTATALVGEQFRCFEAGMNDYMTKPFEFNDLYKRIRMQLNKTPSYTTT